MTPIPPARLAQLVALDHQEVAPRPESDGRAGRVQRSPDVGMSGATPTLPSRMPLAVLSEDAWAESQPSGSALGWLLAILFGCVATSLMCLGPRIVEWNR